jgi:hypothetical protein
VSGAALLRGVEPRVFLELGRVSNLPTVWSNVLAGMVLSGGWLAPGALLAVLAGASAIYVGGMFLNDAFDAEIDARERPSRPIPSGRIARRAVFAIGFALLAGGVLLFAAVSLAAALVGLALAGTVVLYDAWHKGNVLSPLVMGLCRVLVYLVAGFAAAAAPEAGLYWGAGALLAYLIGLTYVAKQETLGQVRNLWPLAFLAVPFLYATPAVAAGGLALLLYVGFAAWVVYALSFVMGGGGMRSVPRTVVSLIAGMALLDGLLMAWSGAGGLALVAIGCFAMTLAGQRWVAGT